MVEAQGVTCAQKGWSHPAANATDPTINDCEMNDNCCDGVYYCRCGNDGFSCAIDDRPVSALSCHTVVKSMSNDTSSVEEYWEGVVEAFTEEVGGTSSSGTRSAGVTATYFLLTAVTATLIGGIALL